MAVRRNGIWNNPEIGQAFENLSSMFGAPKAADILAYAKARQTVDQTGRLAELFRQSQDPNFDQKRFDRGNIANQSYTPAQSYYAVDTTAATSRSNNAADNVRALEAKRMENETTITTTGMTNDSAERRNVYTTDSQGQVAKHKTEADNARAIQQTQLEQAGALQRQFAQPIKIGTGETVVLPDQTASATGLDARMRGNIELKEGERVVTPSGEVFNGAAKPFTMDQWTAQKAAELASRGEINPADIIMGTHTPVKVTTPAGPAYMSPGEAARTGAPAYVDPGQQSARKDAVAIINGRQVPVTRGPQDLGWKTQDGQPIPADATVMQQPQARGSVGDLGLAPTQTNLTQATNIEGIIAGAENELNGVEKLLKERPGIAGAPGSIRGILQDATAVAQEFTKAFGQDVAAVVDPAKIEQYAAQMSPTRDPYIHQFNTRMLGLAYQHARLNNPGGEVSRQALEASARALGANGFLSNNQSAAEGLAGFREQIASAREQIKTLRKPGMTGGAPAPAAPAAIEEWTRGPDGKLQRVR